MSIGDNELKEGTHIEHVKYGEGIIRKKEDTKLYIFFKNSGKELVMDAEFLITNRIIKIKEN